MCIRDRGTNAAATYWVPGSRKMGYKAGFSAVEIYKGGQWQPLGDPADHRTELHPLSVDPISEQVAKIALPQPRPDGIKARPEGAATGCLR